MNNGSTPAAAGIKQEEESSKMQFEVKIKGCMTDCKFYIPDATTDDDNTALAFRTAYHFAKKSTDNKEICACVGSMLCSVVPGFKNSVEQALNATGIKPCFVSLPSQAHENNIVPSEISLLDFPAILVIFGYSVNLLLKSPGDSYVNDHGNNYNNDYNNNYIGIFIRNLKATVRCDPGNRLDIPFYYSRAYAINKMLGSPDLLDTVKKFLKNNGNHPNSQIRNMCEYLSKSI